MRAEQTGLEAAVRRLPSPWRGTYYEAGDSTQDEARAAAQRGAPGRSIFVADFQRAGRGRQGRVWVARPGTALLMSILFRDTSQRPVPLRWTSLAAVALIDAIEALLTDVTPEIKWPNDVVVDRRKVAGVLAETSWNGQELVAIVGVGVNVSSDARELAPFNATSLGTAVDRGELLAAFIAQIDAWLARPALELHAAWSGRLWGRGQPLQLVDLGHQQDVVVLGVDDDGALRVRLADGSERVTTTGELID